MLGTVNTMEEERILRVEGQNLSTRELHWLQAAPEPLHIKWK
jgi:hypothetical protein